MAKEILKEINFEEMENDNDILDALLAMPDEDFAVIEPVIKFEIEKRLNRSNEKILIAKNTNSLGYTGEELVKAFSLFRQELDNNPPAGISKKKIDFLKFVIGLICNTITDVEGTSQKIINIPIELCHEDAKIPTYANLTDSGMDVYALEDITIHPGETVLVKTGLKVAIPVGYEIQVRPKSGRALKTKMRVANSPGTIDSGYRDEIGIIIDNIEPPIKDITYTSDLVDGKPVYTITSILHGSDMFITKGEKFAQLVLSEVPKVAFYEVDNVSKIENDGRTGGFGSTGLK